MGLGFGLTITLILTVTVTVTRTRTLTLTLTIFKRSLASYVLDNFAANQCAANPILYQLHLA